MRLIGIGLMAFLLAGVALFLASSDTLKLKLRGFNDLMLGPQLVFEATTPDPVNQVHNAMVYRAGADKPIILSGLPAYQSAAFYMPIDAHPTSGYLQIDATVQALVGVEGVLRISIDNTKRAELLLRPGEAGRSLRIQLTEQDIARERLVVSFSLQGEGPHSPCGSDEGVEAIVEIETTSAIFLELESPLLTPRDQVLTRGRTATIGWQTGTYPGSLLAARDLLLAGIDPRFAETGLSLKEAAEAARFFARTSPELPYAWSKTLGERSPAFGMRKFHRTHTWRLRYDMFDSLDTRLPDQLDLHMMLGRLMGDTPWHIVATLNGQILADRVSYGGPLRLGLPLDTTIQGRVNSIEITASAASNTANQCDRGPELIAEIRPDTTLHPSDASFTSPLVVLLDMLKDGWRLTSGDLSTIEAVIATELLATLPSPDPQADHLATVHVLARGTDLSGWMDDDAGHMLMTFDTSGAPVVTPVSEFNAAFTTGVSLLIHPIGFGS